MVRLELWTSHSSPDQLERGFASVVAGRGGGEHCKRISVLVAARGSQEVSSLAKSWPPAPPGSATTSFALLLWLGSNGNRRSKAAGMTLAARINARQCKGRPNGRPAGSTRGELGLLTRS
uniref:Uncharacterized protein n=1 Tax=Arundo donax TaxID=35708 RepID=A0A0A9CGW4_ARUDO